MLGIMNHSPPPPPTPPPFVYSYFEKGCRKKCTRQSWKVLWVVSSAMFFKEIWKNGTGGHGHMFASAKGKQQKYVRQLQSSETVYWWYPILPFGIVACTFFSDNLSRNSCIKYDEKTRGGKRGRWVFPEKLGRGCAARFLKYLPYFRPKSVIFPTLFQIWSPGARRVNA